MELTPEERCLLSPTTQTRILRHEDRCRNYERILRRIRRNIFDYDAEQAEKAQRVIEKIKAACEPAWRRRRAAAQRELEERVLFRTA